MTICLKVTIILVTIFVCLNAMDEKQFRVVIVMIALRCVEILFKQRNDLICVIQILLHRQQRQCPSRPNSPVVPKNIKKVHKIVLTNQNGSCIEIAKELKISERV